jgi:hypothetical protein
MRFRKHGLTHRFLVLGRAAAAPAALSVPPRVVSAVVGRLPEPVRPGAKKRENSWRL